MQAWRVYEFGEPGEVLRLEELPSPVPGPGEVLVRVAATTLNFNDVDGVRGRYMTVRPPLPYTPGMEVLGSVEDAGAGAEALLGRRVVAVPSGAFGGYAQMAVAPRAMTFEMPPEAELPDTAAAAMFMPFHLSWLALHERANVRAGETVLVHAAAGGIGSAAVQLAAVAGARVIATAGSAEKVELCLSLGADVAVNYLETDFVDAVLEATDGRGVDVAFDSVGGDVTTKTFRCMAFNGRHLLVGFASGIEAEDEGIVPRPVLFGNFSLYGVCLAYVDSPSAVKEVTGYNFPSYADGRGSMPGSSSTSWTAACARSWVVPLPSTRFRALCKPWRTVRPSGATSSSSGRRPAERPAYAVSCLGIVWCTGTGYDGMWSLTSRMSSSVHPSAITLAGWSFEVLGREGTDASPAPMCSVEVRSPAVLRRQAEMLGALTPKRSSKKRSCEVWSKTSEATCPPRLKGDSTSMGTRKPMPTGPRMPLASAGSVFWVRYSPGVPAGGTGGGTWSKKPSFSSYMWNSTVLDQTSGFDVSAARTWLVSHSPSAGGEDGCSS